MLHLVFILILALSTLSCVRPVGGSCSYKIIESRASISEVTDTYVKFDFFNEGFIWGSLSQVDSKPIKGDTYIVKLKQITSGSCTPVMFLNAKRY